MKDHIIKFTVTLSGLAILLTLTSNMGVSQGGVKNTVILQPATPGTSQSGHANISGTMISARLLASSSAGLAAIVSGINASSTVGSSGVRGEASAATGTTYGVFGVNQSSSGRAVYGLAPSTTGSTQGVYGRSDSTSGVGILGLASSSTGLSKGVYGESESTSGYGVHGVVMAATGVNYGIYGETESSSGRGVYGRSNSSTGSTYGVYGSAVSTSGRGVYGTALATTGVNYGVSGNSESSTGYGVYGTSNYIGVAGNAGASGGTGVYGFGNVTDGRGVEGQGREYGVRGVLNSGTFQANGAGVYGLFTGTGNQQAGVRGETTDPNSFGMYARNDAITGGSGIGLYVYGGLALEVFGLTFGGRLTGSNYGVLGQAGRTSPVSAGTVGESTSATGSGVRGQRSSFTELGGTYLGVEGIASEPSDRGVQGDSDATTGTPYGVFGDTDGAGWAVYASGNSGASGTKSFRIDHPLDPENKYLLHYSSEAPEPMNFYSGNAVTGADGYAWVQLPEYFDAINRDIRYQLTVIDSDGEFAQAIVSKKVNKNRFQIRTSRPLVEVSWRIEAVRNDAYVRHYPQPVEVEKSSLERGSFEHPEIWGQDAERSFFHDRPSVKKLRKTQQQALEDIKTIPQKSKPRSGRPTPNK